MVAAAWPRAGEFFTSSGEFVRFLSPATIWQRVPVVARRSDAPSLMLVSFHPRRLHSDPCQTPDMVSRKWSTWIEETDSNIRSISNAKMMYNDVGPRSPRDYSGGGGNNGGDGGGGSSSRSISPATLRHSPSVTTAELESTALLSLQRALRPNDDAIGLSAALWKDQVGSWGKPPNSQVACPTDGGRAWEAVACSDDRQHVVKVKLLGLSDSTFGKHHHWLLLPPEVFVSEMYNHATLFVLQVRLVAGVLKELCPTS